MNKFTNYRDYAKEVEARLNRAVKFPVPCMVYERYLNLIFSGMCAVFRMCLRLMASEIFLRVS